MITYPLEFHRRSEQKWALRSRRDALIQMPWLREIGQWLRAGYDAVDQPMPERLAALLKQLEGRPN
jgi:hypothetical protein